MLSKVQHFVRILPIVEREKNNVEQTKPKVFILEWDPLLRHLVRQGSRVTISSRSEDVRVFVHGVAKLGDTLVRESESK
jgi:hypothetical protein